MTDPRPPKLFIIAGEPSGDALGAPVIDHLRTSFDNIMIAGIGGDRMTDAGLESLFPMEELSVMGLTEVLPRLPLLLRRIRETAREIERTRPDVIVTIDSPDFTLRVAKKIRHLGIPVVHYVAPTVWAWRPGRARKLARIVDHVMTLFPFEPRYFEAEGLKATFVGHPVVEQSIPPSDTTPPSRKQLVILPGSRRGEIERLMPVFGETIERLSQQEAGRDLHLVIPTLPHLRDTLAAMTRSWVRQPEIESDRDRFYETLCQSTVALCASGTVVLELAKAAVPGVIAYRVSPLTAAIARRLIKLEHVSLVNIIAGREVMPEYLQEQCTAPALSAAIAELLESPSRRDAQKAAFGDVMQALGQGDTPPSERTAQVIGGYLAK